MVSWWDEAVSGDPGCSGISPTSSRDELYNTRPISEMLA